MWRNARLWLLAAAFAGTPLVTTATCNRGGGTFDFYRDDDYYRRDEIVDIELWPFDERVVIYEEWEDDCHFCF